MERVYSILKQREELNKLDDFSDQMSIVKGDGFHSKLIKVGYRTVFTKLLKYIGNNATVLNTERAIKQKYGELIGIDRYYSIHTIFTSSIYEVGNSATFFCVSMKTLLTFNSELCGENYITGFRMWILS